MSVNLNRERAIVAWGTDLPRWIALLADACDRTNQRVVADRLGKSGGYVSRVLNRAYAGSYEEAEKIVRAAYADEHVLCPALGATPIEMPLRTCIRNRRRARPANWAQVAFARACPGCSNNTDRTDPTEED